MPDDKEAIRRAFDLQARARDYRLPDLPGYGIWSERRLGEGVSDALIAHLDSTSMWLLPEEIADVPEAAFEELLEDLQDAIGDHGQI